MGNICSCPLSTLLEAVNSFKGNKDMTTIHFFDHVKHRIALLFLTPKLLNSK